MKDKATWGLLLAALATLVLAVLSLMGCSSLPSSTARLETTYQVLHAVDTAQTLHIAREPEHYTERMSAWAIGEHPSQRSVIAFMGTEALLHYGATSFLARRSTRAANLWEGVSIAVTGRNLYVNWKLGL